MKRYGMDWLMYRGRQEGGVWAGRKRGDLVEPNSLPLWAGPLAEIFLLQIIFDTDEFVADFSD
jgi:hypothetical protein